MGGALENKLKEMGLPSGETNMAGTFNHLTKDIFVRLGDKFYLTFEAYFQLHEHERLEEARKSSRNAMIIAIASLILATIVGIGQIWAQLCVK